MNNIIGKKMETKVKLQNTPVFIGTLLVLLAIPLTIYLSQQKQDIRRQAASGNEVAFVDTSGNTITQTTSATVNIRISSPWPPAGFPIPTPTPISQLCSSDIDCPAGQTCQQEYYCPCNATNPACLAPCYLVQMCKELTPTPTSTPTPTAPPPCLADAKQCPDGTYVVRQSPTCEFTPCPSTVTPTPTVTPTRIPTPTPTPTPGQICAQVLTPALNSNTGECRVFPTPCDVPQGWQVVSACAAPNPPVCNYPIDYTIPAGCGACWLRNWSCRYDANNTTPYFDYSCGDPQINPAC